MRFRSAVRPRSGHVFLIFLPVLLGGGGSSVPPGLQDGEDGRVPPRGTLSSPSPVWVFLTREAWEDPGIVQAFQARGARIRTRSRLLRALSLVPPASGPGKLSDIPGVLEIRPVGKLRPPGAPSVALPTGPGVPGRTAAWRSTPSGQPRPVPEGETLPADSAYGELGPFLDILEIPRAHELGFSGAGVRIGILDGLFMENHGAFRSNQPLAVNDVVDGDASVSPGPGQPLEAAAHGTALWSLLTGNLPGFILGGAPEAGILLVRIREGDVLTTADEDRWVAGLEWLLSQGARIVLSGVGFRVFPDSEHDIGDLNGDITPATRAADRAARQGVLVVAPVGNAGPGLQSLEAPADGDSVLAAGAVDPTGSRASFSALGPTGDGRPKPDLMAPGEDVPATNPSSAEPIPVSGTEFAGALLAAAAALFVEAYPDRGPMEVLEALRSASRPETEPYSGVPWVASAILFPEGVSVHPLQAVGEDGTVTNLGPRFRWDVPLLNPLALPVTFRLQFAEDLHFQRPLWADSVVGTFARRPSRPLPPRSTLYWRVEASSTQEIVRRSDVRGPLEVSDWVSLDVLNDPAGTQLTDPQPEFRWTALELPPPLGPFSYELQIVSDRGGEPVESFQGLSEERFTMPEALPFNEPFRWRVIARAREGSVDTVTSAGPFVVTSGASPPVTILFQNFPNPFPNPEVAGGNETRIWFDLARESEVDLAVFDSRGRLVRPLIPGPGCAPVRLPPGLYGRETGPSADPCLAFSWDGRDDRGIFVSPGMYLLRLKAGSTETIRRMVFRR